VGNKIALGFHKYELYVRYQKLNTGHRNWQPKIGPEKMTNDFSWYQ